MSATNQIHELAQAFAADQTEARAVDLAAAMLLRLARMRAAQVLIMPGEEVHGVRVQTERPVLRVHAYARAKSIRVAFAACAAELLCNVEGQGDWERLTARPEHNLRTKLIGLAWKKESKE